MVRFMSRALLSIVAASAAVAACAPTMGPPPPGGRMGPPPPAVGGPFRAEDFAWASAPGRGGVVGHVTYREGPIRFGCSGASVVLTPETPWTRQRMIMLYQSPERAAQPVEAVRARTPAGPSGDYSAFVRRATCDAVDRFSFSGVPDGAWYVITTAKPVSGPGQTVALMRRVVVRGGRVSNVEL